MPVVMSEEFAAQVAKVVRETLRKDRGTDGHSGRWQGRRSAAGSYWAITNSSLAAPSNGVTTPTTCTIEYLRVNDSGNLVRTGETDTLTHRWEGITLETNTLIRVRVAENEVILVGADCEALESPPS